MISRAVAPRVAALQEMQSEWMQPVLEQLRISAATFQLLTTVFAGDGQLSQAELGRRLGLAPATISEAIAAQVKAGILTQGSSDTDGRVRTVQLTSRGQELVVAIRDRLQAGEAELERLMGVQDYEDLGRLLDKAMRAWENLLISVEENAS